MTDTEHVGRLVDTTAVAELWAAHGSRLTAERRLQIVELVKRRISSDEDRETDIDFVLDEADALRDALRAHVDAVVPAAQLVEARLRIGIAVANLAARAASRRLASLEETALIDPLTGLGNRRAASSAFEAALASARRHDTPIAVALVDLDGLKLLNDRQGHAAGDAALVALADALRQSMRADDGAFRFGGDEFVVLAPVSTASDLIRLFDRVRLTAPAFTVGIAEAPRDGMTQDALVAVADQRMYARRQLGAVATATTAASRRRLATVGAALIAMLALVGPVLALTAPPDGPGERASNTTTTTMSPPPTSAGFVGATGGAATAPPIVDLLTRDVVAPVPSAPSTSTSAAPTTAITATTTRTPTTSPTPTTPTTTAPTTATTPTAPTAPTTTTTTVDSVAAASGRGRGGKPDEGKTPGRGQGADRAENPSAGRPSDKR